MHRPFQKNTRRVSGVAIACSSQGQLAGASLICCECRWCDDFSLGAARLTIQVPMFILAVAIVVDGFWGPQASPMNLAGVLPWIHWRGFVVFGLLIAGNVSCMACPFTLPRSLAQLVAGRPNVAPLVANQMAFDRAAAEFSVGLRAWPRGAVHAGLRGSLSRTFAPPSWSMDSFKKPRSASSCAP